MSLYKMDEQMTYENGYEHGYQQGKADAIDELVTAVSKYYTGRELDGDYVFQTAVIKQKIADLGKQIKEKKTNGRE